MWSKERDLVFQAPGFSHSANSCSAAAPPSLNLGPRPGALVGRALGQGGRPGVSQACPPGSHPSPTPHPRRTTIWAHRVRFLEEQALPHWATFTIWNAGRQGRRLYRSLTAGSQRKVGACPCTTPRPSPIPACQAALPPLPLRLCAVSFPGGCLLRRGREQDQKGFLLLRGLSGAGPPTPPPGSHSHHTWPTAGCHPRTFE